MKSRLIGTEDREEWHAALKRLPESDVYFSPEYHRAHELNGDGKALAFIAEEGDDMLFHPFFLRPIERVGGSPLTESWHDVESVYGYSGPLCTASAAANSAFLEQAWHAFGRWCRDNGVIAEFIRFHPLLGNFRYADGAYDLRLDRETVVIELPESKEALWENYPSGFRTKIRKAIKSGLTCVEVEVPEGLETFKRLYRRTMEHNKAAAFYFFSDNYFEYLAESLGASVRLFEVKLEQTIAAGLFFHHGNYLHYHLGGSDPEARDARPNNLLFHTAAEWGCERGARLLHLGGGRKPGPDDSLFRFKASLSDQRRPFYTGRRVHNQEVYETLCSSWMTQTSRDERPNYFLLYRMEEMNDRTNN